MLAALKISVSYARILREYVRRIFSITTCGRV